MQQLTELLQRGADADAAALAATARRQFPVAVELIRLHGIALLRLDRRKEALIALNRAVELAPGHVELQCTLANFSLTEGKPDARDRTPARCAGRSTGQSHPAAGIRRCVYGDWAPCRSARCVCAGQSAVAQTSSRSSESRSGRIVNWAICRKPRRICARLFNGCPNRMSRTPCSVICFIAPAVRVRPASPCCRRHGSPRRIRSTCFKPHSCWKKPAIWRRPTRPLRVH